MSSETMFWYTRRQQGKDSAGNPIIFELLDCLNIYEVSRAFWEDPYTLVLMMKDGHEETRLVEIPPGTKGIDKSKPPQKERAWFMSQLRLNAKDAARFKLASEIIVDDSKIVEMKPTVIPMPKPEDKVFEPLKAIKSAKAETAKAETAKTEKKVKKAEKVESKVGSQAQSQTQSPIPPTAESEEQTIIPPAEVNTNAELLETIPETTPIDTQSTNE
jgi:hypothetical protein